MNVGWGGSQPHMHHTVIQEGCLGDQLTTLGVGETQHLVFQTSDSPPFASPDAPADDVVEVQQVPGLPGQPLVNKTVVLQPGYVGKPKGLRQVYVPYTVGSKENLMFTSTLTGIG